jgi:hypothetical protein
MILKANQHRNKHTIGLVDICVRVKQIYFSAGGIALTASIDSRRCSMSGVSSIFNSPLGSMSVTLMLLLIHLLPARAFEKKFPSSTRGFVDSSHEARALRLHELDPNAPWLIEATARQGFFVEPDEHLTWRTELPVVVLCHWQGFSEEFADE